MQIMSKDALNDKQKALSNRCYTKEDFSIVNRFESKLVDLNPNPEEGTLKESQNNVDKCPLILNGLWKYLIFLQNYDY